MKVAIFGCLHGMLNEMFKAVTDHEQTTGTQVEFILVCGDCQTIRHKDDLRCIAVPDKYKELGDFHEYYSGKKKVPKLTIFVGGNHEASNYLMTLPYGGWVCENFYYMGYAGVINYKGLRLAGISGIYNFHDSNRGRYECMPLDGHSVRSIYHTRQLDVFRLQLLTNRANQNNPIDVFLSHDWPARIYNHGDLQQLLRFKPMFKKDVESRSGLGNPLTEPLVHQLKPRRWFAAHLHCRFYAKVKHDQSNSTEFLSLNKIEKGRRFVDFVDLAPEKDQEDDNNLSYDLEWLTILRKTIELESSSWTNSQCPIYQSAEYQPTEEDIQSTKELMDKSGGIEIKHNFRMSEPVIYDRSDGLPASQDEDRCKYFTNPQHEELCSRLQIKSLLHVPLENNNGRPKHLERDTYNTLNRNKRYCNSSNPTRGFDRNHAGPSNNRGRARSHFAPRGNNRIRSNFRDDPISAETSCSGRPVKKRAFELDEDGCLPCYVDKRGES